jgi:hypothetical protein
MCQEMRPTLVSSPVPNGNQKEKIYVHASEELRLCFQECEMTINLPNFAVGSVLGVVLGVIADWQIGTRLRNWSQLRGQAKEYGSLDGQYATYRIRDDGTHEPTGGTVDIAWQQKDGLLEASGFDAAGNPEWHSYIRMNEEYPGTGIGHYNNSNSIHGGVQQVIYSKQTRSFNVMGTSHMRKEFAHCWKQKK